MGDLYHLGLFAWGDLAPSWQYAVSLYLWGQLRRSDGACMVLNLLPDMCHRGRHGPMALGPLFTNTRDRSLWRSCGGDGGYLLLFPKAKVDVLFIFIIFFRIFSLPAWIILGIWIALQFLNGFSTPADEAGVAYWAHIGGFVAGLLLCWPLFNRLGGRAYWQTHLGHPPHPDKVYTIARSRVPKIKRRRS